MFAISTDGVNDYIFGMHDGHLNDRAEVIAALCGCTLARFTDPKDGKRRGWFAMRNLGTVVNEAVEDAVLSRIEAQGGFAAFRMRYEEFTTP
jgi:hypothetical protein